jgi:hypothetical protein
MTGTVLNDHIKQSQAAADAAISFLKGETIGKYFMLPYLKVS